MKKSKPYSNKNDFNKYQVKYSLKSSKRDKRTRKITKKARYSFRQSQNIMPFDYNLNIFSLYKFQRSTYPTSKTNENIDFKKEKSFRFKIKGILGKTFKFIAGTLVTVYLGYNFTNIVSNSKQEIKYSVDIPQIQPSTKLTIVTDREHPQEENYNIYSKMNLSVFAGELKELYLVYTAYDNQDISNMDFHKISFNSSINKFNFLKALFLPINKNNALSNVNYDTTIHYNYNPKNELPKCIYLLSIDKESNPNIVLITLEAEPNTKNTKTTNDFSLSHGIDLNSFTKPVKHKQINASDFLGNENLNKLSEQFLKDKKQILNIYTKLH